MLHAPGDTWSVPTTRRTTVGVWPLQGKMSPVHASENGAEVCPGGRFEVRFRVRGFAHEASEAPVTPALVTMSQGLRDSSQ